MGLFGIIAGIVGALGVAGTIALFLLAPALASALFKGALAILGSIWDTRPGLGLIVGGVCLCAGLVMGDNFGESRVQKKWDAARAAAVVEANKTDDHIAVTVEKLDTEATTTESEFEKKMKEARNAYFAHLENRAGGACALDDYDVERLRNIR